MIFLLLLFQVKIKLMSHFRTILLMDEVMPELESETSISDWSSLDTANDNVDFLIALSPQNGAEILKEKVD